MTLPGQQPLLEGSTTPRVLIMDEDAGILYLKPGETPICPACWDTERQSWECGEPDHYEMTCQECGHGYGVSVDEAP